MAWHAPSTKAKCDYLNGWIDSKTVTHAQISPKMVNLSWKTKEKKEGFSLHFVG